MKAGGALSIWFFTGLCLGVNGLLIFARGIYETIHPPENQVVLANLHANIWWGGILLVLGIFYCLHFSPAKERKRNAAQS